MGNCQAIDTATLAIQHPNGKVERMYSPVSASQVMKANPGHHVAIRISPTSCPSQHHPRPYHHLRHTRIKLLKPSDSLLLGHVYRLITSQGSFLLPPLFALLSLILPLPFLTLLCFFSSKVMRGLWAKKQAKMKKILSESERPSFEINIMPRINAMENNQERTRETEGGRRRRTSNGGRGRTWEPSLQSISEASS